MPVSSSLTAFPRPLLEPLATTSMDSSEEDTSAAEAGAEAVDVDAARACEGAVEGGGMRTGVGPRSMGTLPTSWPRTKGQCGKRLQCSVQGSS